MSFVRDTISDLFGGGEAAKATKKASDAALEFQREAFDYLKEDERLPRQFRDEGLTMLGGLYGLEGGEGSQQELIDQAMQSPLYNAILGTRDAGEEAIMRNAAATGGLRSGNVQSAMYDYNQRLGERALLEGYNQQLRGLEGLAGLGTNAGSIASQLNTMGGTTASGIAGAEQARQNAFGQGLNAITTMAAAFSDPRLKEDIQKVGEWKGHNVYSWRWVPEARHLGLEGRSRGLMADEVQRTHPHAVKSRLGYLMIDYDALEAEE